MSLVADELPDGWIEASLSEVVTCSTEKVEPGEDDNAPYLSLEHIESNSCRIIGQGRGADVKSTKNVFQAGDVLYGKLRPYLNKVCRPDFDGMCSTDILVLRPTKSIHPGFLFQVLSSNYVVAHAVANSSGINLPRTSFAALGEFEFGLPPLPEQRRIVAKIEALQSRSRKAREALEAIPPLLEQFRQSVLAAAFRGDLTADWREQHPEVEPASVLLDRIRTERRRKWEESELTKFKAKGKLPKDDSWKERYIEPEPVDDTYLPELPEGWCWVSIDMIANKVSDGVHRKPSYVNTGIPFLSVKNLTAGNGISLDDVKFVSQDDHDEFIKRTHPEKGDILVTKDGTLGVIRLIDFDAVFSIFVSLALIKSVHPNISPFIAKMLESPQGQSGMKATGTGLQHIHLVDLKATVIPFAPLNEQKEIVRIVEERSFLKSSLSELVADSQLELTQLDQSILAKAFRGELVPQDPNDEPASQLLERIQSERADDTIAKPASGRRKRTTAKAND